MEFLEVSEGLQHQEIDAAFRECFDLLAEGPASFFKRSFSQGLDSCSQWANRSRDPHIETLGGLTGEPRTHPIHVRHFVGQAMPSEAESVRSESIRFNDFRP